MKINYNVLWIEDDSSWYKTTCKLFTDSIAEQGFKLVPKKCVNFEEVKDINKNGDLKKFDILLVDFTLRDSASGDEIINYLRGVDIYTDVIFYSSAIEDVRESMQKHGLEGVYTSHRKEIEDKFEIVFNTTIKKIQEINSMRGLVVGETSEIDVIIEELSIHIVRNILGLEQGELDKIVHSYIDGFIKPKPDKELKRYGELGFDNYFNQIEAFRKWNIFRGLLKHAKFKDDSTIQLFLDKNETYFTEVMSLRNKFAHAKSIEKDGKTVLKAHVGDEHFEYDDEKFIKIRSELMKHSENFEDLVNYLMPK